jgi:CDP-diacylglycerol--glycerol-3-phosphate 3-phosphatidyltransferase
MESKILFKTKLLKTIVSIFLSANLSHDYFTNRQDRYIEIKNSPEVADFFHQLVSTVKTCSLQLNKSNTTTMHPSFPFHPTQDTDGGKKFINEASSRLLQFLDEYINKQTNILPSDSKGQTWVVPLIQMLPYGIRQDEMVTSELLASLPKDSILLLASGYFNLTSEYINLILNSKACCDILTAHPSANGFYKAKGVAGKNIHFYYLLNIIDLGLHNFNPYLLSHYCN